MTTFAQARDYPRANPVYLCALALKNGGPTLYFSDRNLTVGGQTYEDYIDSIDGISDEVSRADSAFLNADLSIRFKNTKITSSSTDYNYLILIGDTYPFEGATITITEVYLDDNGTASTAATVFKGTLDSPEDIDDLSFTCRVSSRVHALARNWIQAVIDNTDYVSAYEDVGKIIPIVYGSNVLIPALRVDWGAQTTLLSSITDSATSIILSDASRFPASGSVYIDAEKITYTGKSSNTLTGCTRGASGTTATTHGAGAVVWEAQTYYDSILCDHDASVGTIYAEIEGRLWRVISGVTSTLFGSRRGLRATAQIKVSPVEDDTDVTVDDNIKVDLDDDITVTTDGLSTLVRYPSGHFQGGGAAYDGAEQTSVCGKACGVYYTAPSPNPGPISDQYHYAVVSNSKPTAGGLLDGSESGRLRLRATSASGVFRNDIYTDIPNTGEMITVRLAASGGDWDDKTLTSWNANHSEYCVHELWKEVVYTPTINKTGNAQKTKDNVGKGYYIDASLTGQLVSTYVVDRFHAVVTRTGLAAAEDVLDDFLQNELGFAAGEIGSFDATSINFAFALVDEVPDVVAMLQDLAFQCRSVLRYVAGQWVLTMIPSSAPASAKTITQGELAGEFAKPVFSKARTFDLGNDLSARYDRNYSLLRGDSEYNGTVEASDATSISKYGTYPKQFDFWAIASSANAATVLANILLRTKQPYLTVRFPVFYEHFDLVVGNTITLTANVWTGKKFFIESFRRLDPARAEITAVEWWT